MSAQQQPTGDLHVPMRIVLRRPPAGVRFALQRGAAGADGAAEIICGQMADGRSDLAFEFTIRARIDADGSVRFLGPMAQGPAAARFVYVTVGSRAGQPESPWDRRAKVPLAGVSADIVRATLADSAAVLEATLEGALADGSPTCATQPFVEKWHRV